MAKSAAELLDEVDAAISRALVTQRYRSGSGQLANEQENPDIEKLMKVRERLVNQINSGGGSMASLAEVGSPI